MSVPSNVVSMKDPVIPVNQSIYEISTEQKAPLGTRLRVGERTFHYALAATTVAPGVLLQHPTILASNSGVICNVKTAATTGASVISVSVGTAVIADQYTEGYLIPAEKASTGGGLMMKIKSHPAVATNTSGNFTLFDALPMGVAAQPCTLVPNPFNKVTVGSSTGLVAGVAPIAAVSGDYFWLQTWGPAAVVGSAAHGNAVSLMFGSAGYASAYLAQGASSGGLPAIGWAAVAGIASYAEPVMLMLTP